MRVKDDSVSLVGIRAELVFGLIVVREVFAALGKKVVITSGSEHSAKHSATSLHYDGKAVDLRTWEWTMQELQGAKKEIESRLGPDFEFIIEDNHIHFEFQPKWKGRVTA